MSDEDAAAEDARVDVYSQVIQDWYSLIQRRENDGLFNKRN